MWPLVEYVLRFTFTIAAIFALNIILLAGVRDILYFVLPIGPPTLSRLRSMKSSRPFTGRMLLRIVFWVAFAFTAVFLINFLLSFALFIVAAHFVFSAAERGRISAGRLIMLSAMLLTAVTFEFIRRQPVLLQFDRQFSVDLWVYNASNSLIDALLSACNRLKVDTAGIERLEALVPWIQHNIFGLLFLSLYFFSAVFFGRMARLILPGTKYEAPVYYRVPPVRELGLIAAPALAAAVCLGSPQVAFVVAGIYYLWGVNLLIYWLRGGRWALNLFIAAAGALHPALVVTFISLGVFDNLLDIRRLSAVLGFETGFADRTGESSQFS